MNKKKKREFINGLDKLDNELNDKISSIDNNVRIMTPEGINNQLNKLSIVELEYYANKLIAHADDDTIGKIFNYLQDTFNIGNKEFDVICPKKDKRELMDFTLAWFKSRNGESIKLLILKFKALEAVA
jgi:hypothetical protein